MPELLFARDSEFQRIELTRESDGSLALTLDDVWQFSSRDEATFHEMLVDVAMVTAPSIRRVAILGGGDGLAARNVLRYPEVEAVTLCELDPAVIEMTRDVDAMAQLCARSLSDPRVTVLVDDALRWVERVDARFDVLICDFPTATDASLEALHGASFFASLRRILAPQGVVAAQVSLDPPGFWEVVEGVERSFRSVQSRLVALADDTWADFVYAAEALGPPRRPLAAGLSFLTPPRVGTTRIVNRSGRGFETLEYGDAPDFGD